MTILAIAASLVLASGNFGQSYGNMGKSSGTLKPAPSSGASRPIYGPAAPQAPRAPKPPSYGGADDGPFKPYKGQSTYSNRGGVNGYPSPDKPKGYINPYGR